MTVRVTNSAGLLDALNNVSVRQIVVRPGKYHIDTEYVFDAITDKQVFGEGPGPVQIIGALNLLNCRNLSFYNLSIRCPLVGVNNLTSLDAVKIINGSWCHFSRCSILGGADETISCMDSELCSVSRSIVGACFKTTRNHEYACLVQCNGFEFTQNIVLGCDRRIPQIGGHTQVPNDFGSVVKGNILECGNSMTLGLKAINYGLTVDIRDNRFVRVPKTNCDDVLIANGTSADVTVCFVNNKAVDTNGQEIEATLNTSLNSQYLIKVPRPSDPRAFLKTQDIDTFNQYSDGPGPLFRDSWDNHVLTNLGTGKTYYNESELPAL